MFRRLRYGGVSVVIAVVTMGYMAVRAMVGVWAWLALMGVIPNTVPQVESSGVNGQIGSSSVSVVSSCPARCACFGTTVDCAKRGLTRLPRGVPPDTQRL